MRDEIDDAIERLILEGILEVSGIDSISGEFLYSFTPKLQEVYPGLSGYVSDFINQEIMLLWQDGYLDIDFSKDEPMVKISEKSLDEREVAKLSLERQSFLRTIMQRFEDS